MVSIIKFRRCALIANETAIQKRPNDTYLIANKTQNLWPI